MRFIPDIFLAEETEALLPLVVGRLPVADFVFKFG